MKRSCVNKAPRGATAQTMRILTRDQNFPFQWQETIKLKVSTGREKAEQYFTATPLRIFNIDNERVYRMAYSKTWDNSPMPFAMFLDARYGNRTTGIAIHGAPPGSEAKLGRRASPSFAWDPERSRTSAAGALKRKLDGNIATKRGFKALVVIVDARD